MLDLRLGLGARNPVGAVTPIPPPPPPNLLTNGNFLSGLTGWINAGAWTEAGGEATIGPDGALNVLSQTVTVTGGSQHTLTLTLGTITTADGNIICRAIENNGANADTTHEVVVALSGSPSPDAFTPAADCTSITVLVFVISNVAEAGVDAISLVNA